MRKLHLAFTYLVLTSTLSGCASLKSYDMPKVQTELSGAYQSAENVAQKVKADFTEKQGVIAHLKKTNPSGFGTVQATVESHMREMQAAMADIFDEKRKMSESNSQVAGLAYNRGKVHSHEQEFNRIDDAVSKFEVAARTLNEANEDYSKESNALAKLVADRKLYFNFDVAEFQSKVDESIRQAQSTQTNMKSEIERGQALTLNWPKVQGRREGEKVLVAMTTTAQNFTSRAQKLSLISRDMHRVTAGYANVATTESIWPEVQKLIADFEKTNAETQKLSAEFGKQNASLKQLASK